MDAKINPNTDSTPRWGLWWTLIFGFVLGGIFLLLNGLLIWIYVGITGKAASYAEKVRLIHELRFNGFIFSIFEIISAIICGALLVAVIKLKRGASIREYLGLISFNSNQLFSWGGMLVVLIMGTDLSYYLIGLPIIPEFDLAIYKSAKYPLILFLAIIIFGPLWEECFFRGFLLKGLSHSFLRPLGAVLITSAVWTVVHTQYELHEIIPIFIGGCLLGAARVKTGALSIAIIMHSFWNFVSFVETIIYLKWT